MSNHSRTDKLPRKTFFQSEMGKKVLEKSQQRAVRRGRTEKRLAERAGMINLPKPDEFVLPIDFDPAEGVFMLGDEIVYVDRASTGGYQREYDDARARQYGMHFDWGLYGRPLLNRRDDGSLWVISGQHRLASAAYAGHDNVPVLIYNGLTLTQEAYLFNQEATQKRDLTSLDKFHSGVQSGFPDHIAVSNIVESLGGKIALKHSAHLHGGDTTGITAVRELLNAYDYVGEEVLYEALSILRDAFGSLTGKGIDGALYSAMALFVGIYSPDSPYGTMDRKKMVQQLQRTTPTALRAKASQYEGHGRLAGRFMALLEAYNHKAAKKRLDLVSPDWRRAVVKEFCIAPGCRSGARGRAGRATRRNLCRYHYELSQGGEDVMLGGR